MRRNEALNYVQLVRHFGLPWVANRTWYEVKRRTGVLKRKSPAAGWEDFPPERFLRRPELHEPDRYLEWRRRSSPRFFFSASERSSAAELLKAWDTPESSPLEEARAALKGRFRYFSDRYVDLGNPPRWRRNPLLGRELASDLHWSEIDDFESGDIKIVWEPNRYGFVYSLVRAYWRTGDEAFAEAFAEAFWKLVESWREQNPPNRGPNWKCGQEIAFRVMACCFGLYGFLDSEATTGKRLAELAAMLFASGERIASNLDYALNQKNNHGISEAVGLWTLGTLFPEFQTALRWRELGRELLERQASELIYSDGAFSQHSFKYQRVMLHDYLWAARLAELDGEPFSSAMMHRLEASAGLLYQAQDETSGEVPNYGSNDGTLVLPLSNADYSDFRPVLQSIGYLTRRQRLYFEGIWDEEPFWIFGKEALQAERNDLPKGRAFDSGESGYFVLRSAEGFVFSRCCRFRHRPGHADLLHVDLWWKGVNVLCDPGSFSYNAPAPWNNSLKETRFHNALTVEDRSQMERAGRFLWLPWVRGTRKHFLVSTSGRIAYFEGSHDGYERLDSSVYCQRGVLRVGERLWVILDRAWSAEEREYCVQWLLPDLEHEWDGKTGRLSLQTAQGAFHVYLGNYGGDSQADLVRADPESPRGWRSTRYNSRLPALSLRRCVSDADVRFVTLLSADPLQIREEEGLTIVENPAGEKVTLEHPKDELLSRVLFEGAEREALEVS